MAGDAVPAADAAPAPPDIRRARPAPAATVRAAVAFPVTIRAPFPWFGGKSRVAPLVWARFGDVPNYVEPFAGSLAVLLGRPHKPRTETVNDLDCYLANFWRSLQADPEAVAQWADWPVNEADLLARHRWLVSLDAFRERVRTDPHFYDAKVAGWWVWGQSVWIGSGWCAHARAPEKLPHLGNAGRGVQRPQQKLPHLGDAGRGVQLRAYFEALAERLERVRVACGSWDRVMGDSVTFRHGTTAIFLDPPYDEDEHTVTYAAGTGSVAADVRVWALAGEHDEVEANGWDRGEVEGARRLRIAGRWAGARQRRPRDRLVLPALPAGGARASHPVQGRRMTRCTATAYGAHVVALIRSAGGRP